MALESVRVRRSRNADGISEERREEFRNFAWPPIFGPVWAPRARHLKLLRAALDAQALPKLTVTLRAITMLVKKKGSILNAYFPLSVSLRPPIVF
jgi:hypothetical protein